MNKKTRQTKLIVLAGGGTMGPVSALFAIAESIQKQEAGFNFLLIGTSYGPESMVASKFNIKFKSIITAKLRRYWTLSNLFIPFQLIIGFVQSFFILLNNRPKAVIGAGGFTQVPVMYAAWFMRIPVFIHQQDVLVTLSNTLCSIIAKKITVTFEHSLRDFSSGNGVFQKKEDKLLWTGNPFRESILHGDRLTAQKYFKLSPEIPTILILGGSSGAKGINDLVFESLPLLLGFCQVIHATGKDAYIDYKNSQYHPYSFIDRMDLAYQAADIVVSRAGLSTITELSALKKVSIIIPMPDTHQEFNASLLWQSKAAAVYDQTQLTPEDFSKRIRELMHDARLQNLFKNNIHKLMPSGADEKIAKIILKNI
jgi:UDP-N-acetylglucosamine--N-acetylmuramyl-(pentapeptide) pyrophosphoryl-undecaprenol N-acetylglucosamine transferase